MKKLLVFLALIAILTLLTACSWTTAVEYPTTCSLN